MSLVAFLSSLFSSGRVRVPPPGICAEGDITAVDALLVQQEWEYRQGLPGTPPLLDVACARWAATIFYRACQYMVYRDTSAEEIAHGLGDCCPAANPASRHYSVDLVFAYLADLCAYARSASENDVLVAALQRCAASYPLSSVGIAEIEGEDIEVLCAHPTLRTMYVDRILARKDLVRLADRRVQDWMRVAIGAFPELAPEAVKALETYNSLETIQS